MEAASPREVGLAFPGEGEEGAEAPRNQEGAAGSLSARGSAITSANQDAIPQDRVVWSRGAPLGPLLHAAAALLLCLAAVRPSAAVPHYPINRRGFYLYVWAGPANWTAGAEDMLAVFRVNTQRRYAILQYRRRMGYVGTEPYHIGFNRGRTSLVTGGLLAWTKGVAPVNLWRQRKRSLPRLVLRDSPPGCTAVTGSVGLRNGGLAVACMGGAQGGAGGQIVLYDRARQRVAQFPNNPASLLGSTGAVFAPHAVAASPDGRYILTADWVVPNTTLAGAPGGLLRSTAVRVWNATSYALLRTFLLPASTSQLTNMDLVWVRRCGIVTSPGLAKIFCVDPYQLTLREIYDFGDPRAEPHNVVVNAEQTTMFVSVWGFDSVYRFTATTVNGSNYLDVTGIAHLNTSSGPHSLALTPDQTALIVSNYFLDQTPAGGVVRRRGSNTITFISTKNMNLLPLEINCNTSIIPNVTYRPHGIGVYPLWVS